MRARSAHWVALLLLPVLCSCAALEGLDFDPRDPWERWNRKVFVLNEWFDRHFLRPVARFYDGIIPDPLQRGIRNFGSNLNEPRRIVDHLLQGDWRASLVHTGRLLLNSTLGLAGLSDVATRVGLKVDNTNFGEVLGAWGLPRGPYMVLPGFGSSTVRNAIGIPVDSLALAPEFYLVEAVIRYPVSALGLLQRRADLLDQESLLFGDRYLLLREFYLGDEPSLDDDLDTIAPAGEEGSAEAIAEGDIFDF